MNDQISLEIKTKIAQIREKKQLTHQEYFNLITLFLSDFLVTEEERNQINLILDHLYQGQIKFLD